MSQKGYLTTHEVCARYGFDVAELWRRRLAGKFPEATISGKGGPMWSIKSLDERDARAARFATTPASEPAE